MNFRYFSIVAFSIKNRKKYHGGSEYSEYIFSTVKKHFRIQFPWGVFLLMCQSQM